MLAVGAAAQMDGGFVLLQAGEAKQGQAGGRVRAGGAVVLRGGNATAADFGQGGAIALTAGAALGKESSNRGGSVSISAGAALAGTGGSVAVTSGFAAAGVSTSRSRPPTRATRAGLVRCSCAPARASQTAATS